MMFYIVFTRGNHHLIVPQPDCGFDLTERLQSYGWVEVWDSAPTEFKGAEYAAKHYGAPIPENWKNLT